MNITKKQPYLAVSFIAASALLAGLVNGLFGTGGGIITVFALSHIPYFRDALSKKDIFVLTLISSAIMSLSSAYLYVRAGKSDISASLPYLLPAAAGGICGALLFGRLKTQLLSKIFSVIVIIAGITLFTR